MERTLEIFEGRPADVAGRLERERRVYDFLDGIGVGYDRIDHAPADNMETCAQIDAAFGRMTLAEWTAAVDANPADHAIICKNLFLTNKQQTKFYLLMMPRDKKFLTKDLSAQINSARLSFASAERMLELLDTTPGSVSVLGLMNDKEGRVRLLVDKDILECRNIGCHPCANTSSLRFATRDLFERVIPALGHEPTYVAL